ncbi:MAG: acyl-CoA dehydrogenase N-terminal domain-containing protein, partial [Pseudomonadales bacterium]
MPTYRAPRRDIQFVMHEVLEMAQHYQSIPGGEDVDADMIDAIMEEGAKFAENILAPLNASGDVEGCTWHEGAVTTPSGFKEAYSQYVEAGWPSLAHHPELGGQGLPESLGTMLNELSGTANWAWSMYPGLSHGAMNTLQEHGTEAQKQTYLLPLVEGRWTGTMCLTESHCGTDLGLLRTKAEPQDDGSYKITGTKIFISAGEHDMAENIVH